MCYLISYLSVIKINKPIEYLKLNYYLDFLQIFHVDLWGSDNKKLSEDQIVQALKKVIELSKSPSSEAIGVLTSDNRDNWAKAYQALSKGMNGQSIIFIFNTFQ